MGLGKTSGWVHRTVLKDSRREQVSGATYDRIDDDGLHITVDGEPRVSSVDTRRAVRRPGVRAGPLRRRSTGRRT